MSRRGVVTHEVIGRRTGTTGRGRLMVLGSAVSCCRGWALGHLGGSCGLFNDIALVS